MAEYRPFKCTTWSDPKFEKYSKDVQLLYIYFFTNKLTTESGIYPVSFRTISFNTKLTEEEVRGFLKGELKDRIKYDYKNHVVFVINFLRHNGYGRPELVMRAVQTEKAKTRTTLWKDFTKCYPSVASISITNTNTISNTKESCQRFREVLQKMKTWDKEERFKGNKK